MYNFTQEFKGEKVNIHSRGQYKRVLKEKGLVDVTVPEMKSVRKHQTNPTRKNDLSKVEDRIQRQVQKDGLTKHLQPLLEKCSSTKKEE